MYSLTDAAMIQLGQTGVAYLNDTPKYTPPSGLVVVAITFVEDTIFTNNTTVESTNFTSNSVAGPGTNANYFDGDTFPAGLTIYGRFTDVDISAGAAMLYLGP